jgi:hypothetical protein
VRECKYFILFHFNNDIYNLGQVGPGSGNTGSGKLLGSNAPSTNSMEANIRRMNAANAKNLGSCGPKTLGKNHKFFFL